MFIRKIANYEKEVCTITQKLHGTSAGIHVWCPMTPEELSTRLASEPDFVDNPPATLETQYKHVAIDGKDYWICALSKNRILTPGKSTDNFGFAEFVYEHAELLVQRMRRGVHHGEWTGIGINSGEGLKDKRLYFFNNHKEVDFQNERIGFVPRLGTCTFDKLNETVEVIMEDLKTNGSKLVPGFMRPEGVVVQMSNGTNYKYVFDAEETQWKAPRQKVVQGIKEPPRHAHLMHPIRLEKLMSRDSNLLANYPSNKPVIVEMYCQDLLDEGYTIDFAEKNKYQEFFDFVTEVIKK